MAKRHYWLIVDTETSIDDHVADFGAIVVDRKGTVYKQCAVMVQGIFGKESLFFDRNASGLWAQSSVERRTQAYTDMLNAGTRMLASVGAINRWLERAKGEFDPELTAYNLAFDKSKCRNTQIDLGIFKSEFCLWQASVGNVCNTKGFKNFILQNHRFNVPTDKGNMSFKTDAETVCGYIKGEFIEEPHTALEDAKDFELPILTHILAKKEWRNKITPYDWNAHQVKDHFGVK
mgnify:CR=1 FL=1